MFELPGLYNTKNYICNITLQEIDACEEECLYLADDVACDRDVHELCTIIMNEEGLTSSKNPYDAAELYVKLRNQILIELQLDFYNL